MLRDHYAFQQAELGKHLSELEEAATSFDEARRARDIKAREQAQRQMEQAAETAAAIEPHLAYLWFWARKAEMERDAGQATSARQRRQAAEEGKQMSQAANAVRDAWQKDAEKEPATKPDAFRLTPEVSAINHMPPLSFMVRTPFRLQKPYISKDEREFHLLDNPLRRERVFRAPMVAATSWKGALRAALWQLDYKEENEVTIRLLGNPRGNEEGHAGRLYFYPTFFEKMGLEVINPHSRESGVGERGPILMECVPKGVGTLLLLYVPFGPIEETEEERRAQVAQDLEVLAEGIWAMLTAYGFGAKTSSGFGTAKDQLAATGQLLLRAELSSTTASAPAMPKPTLSPDLPRYLESLTQLHADFRQPEGSLKTEAEYRALIESRGQQYTKKDRQLYAKAQNWWERERRQPGETAAQASAPRAEPEPAATPPVSEWPFKTLSELRALARQVAAQLRNGGQA